MPSRKTGAHWRIVLVILILVAAGASRLEAQSSLSGITSSADAGKPWPNVQLNVVVMDKSGVAQKIDKQSFQLFEDGTERPVHLLGSADSPVSLAFVIDSSGSTFKRKPAILSAVETIIHALPTNSEVMAVSFSYQAYIEMPFTPASNVDVSFLNRLQAAGSTALFDAVVATENYIAANAKNTRRAVVILSDGEDNTSHATLAMAVRSMERPGAPIVHTCTVREPRKLLSPLGESLRGHRIMKSLATYGGGREFNLDSDSASAASQIVVAVRSQYVFEFTATDPARNGKAHKLQVRLSLKDLQVYGMPAYYAPDK